MLVQKVGDFWAIIREYVESLMKANPSAIDGYIVPGSYNPKHGTVSVVVSKSVSVFPTSTEQPLYLYNVPLQVAAHGDQGGPVGGENVVLSRGEGGWIANPMHIETNSPGAPSGERWILPPSYKNETPNTSSVKLTNAGNIDINGMTAATVTAPTITSTASGSETHTAQSFAVTASTSAAILAPSTQIGPSGGPYLEIGSGGLGSTYALVRVFELNALITLFNNHVHSGVQSGSSNSGTTTVPATPAIGSTNTTAG
jgi:hypothetical protein